MVIISWHQRLTLTVNNKGHGYSFKGEENIFSTSTCLPKSDIPYKREMPKHGETTLNTLSELARILVFQNTARVHCQGQHGLCRQTLSQKQSTNIRPLLIWCNEDENEFLEHFWPNLCNQNLIVRKQQINPTGESSMNCLSILVPDIWFGTCSETLVLTPRYARSENFDF